MLHQYILETENRSLVIHVVRSKRKTIGLEVKEDTSITIRVPKKCSDKKIIEVIEKNKQWFLSKYEKQKLKKEQEVTYTDIQIKKYREEARKILTELTDYYAEIMNVTYHKIYIREQKTCWGSCSSKKNISFNWKLILYPKEAQEYVVVHELAHLKYMNHSNEFWKEVEKILPDFKKRQMILKK